MGPYILSVSCVSGDEVQVAIYRREDIFRWLRKLDHEGSNWSVMYHGPEESVDMTEVITNEYPHEIWL